MAPAVGKRSFGSPARTLTRNAAKVYVETRPLNSATASAGTRALRIAIKLTILSQISPVSDSRQKAVHRSAFSTASCRVSNCRTTVQVTFLKRQIQDLRLSGAIYGRLPPKIGFGPGSRSFELPTLKSANWGTASAVIRMFARLMSRCSTALRWA